MKDESKTKRQLIQELIALRQQVAKMEKIEAERKRAEKEFQIIISTAMDGFWIADIQGNFLDVNDAYCRLIGYSRDELLKMRISDIEAIEKPEETAQRIQKIRETGGDRFETRQRCKDSRIVDIEVSVNYRKEIDRMFVFLRDITERKRVEEALRRSEEGAKRLAQENALVAEIGRIIGSAPNIDVVFERFTKAVAKLLPFDRLMINLNSPQKDASFVRYVAGIDIPNRRIGEYVPLAGSATAECMRTKSSLLIQPKEIKDIEEVVGRFPGLLPTFESGIRSIIMVPLISEDQIIGILSLRSTKPEAYTDQDVRVAESISSQIAGVVANAQLYIERMQAEEIARKSEEEAKRLAEENAVMAEIGQIISSTLNIEEVYERFAEEVHKFIPFDRIAVNIIKPEERTFRILYVSGPQVNQRRGGDIIPLAGTGTEEVRRTRASVLMREENQEEILSRCPGLLPIFKAGFRSIMMVPLFSKNEVIGTLNLQSKNPNAYTEMELRLAERVGTQIAGAMANAQLFMERERAEKALRESEEEARRLAQENAVMAEIGRIISSTLNIEEIYERFIEEVRKLIQGDRITIAIANPDGSTLTLAYAWGLEVAGRKTGNVFPLAGTTSEKATQTQSSILTQEEDMEEVLRLFPGLSSYYKAGFQSMIVVPLISKNNVIGTLHFRSLKPKAYTQSDVLLAERVGNEIAGAIANAQLFAERKQGEASLRKSEEEAKRLAQENAVMAEIGRIVGSTLDIEEVYDRFAKEMHKLISFDRVAVNIIDPKRYTFNIPYVSGTQVTDRRTGEVVPLAGTGTEEILRTRTSILIHEENREAIVSRCPGLVTIIKAGFQSIMMVPLISENEVIGVLNIQSTRPKAYTESDLRLAERVSSQIAGAIANALLFIERKRSEEALRESEERYRSILESVEDGYYEVDIAGNFTFFNDSMCQILGYSKEEMMGMNNRQYTDQKNAKKLYQAFNKVFRTEQSAKGCEWEIIKKDGTKRDVDASVSLIKDISGNRIGFRGIVRDISERKQVEKEMAALQEQLRQSQKIEAIGQLAGGIAHDFNNSLTLIKTCSQLALMDLHAGDPLRGTFEMIDKATQQSANLTRQLLAFSRRQIMEMKVIDLNNLLLEMDKMLHRIIGEDIELVNVLAEDLGRVQVDPGQMEQVIINLALNARDAMPRGGKLTIETANVDLDEAYVDSHVGVKPGRYVQVAVSDTGIGMAPEVRDRIFEPFFTTKEKGKGTGLGLSTVYGIVKQSGGNIWVYSEPRKGATFKVYLPCVDEPLEEERAKRIEEELPRGGETVLVAEDDGDVRNLVVQILRKQGYEVLETANGGEAFMVCEKHGKAIDLLVTDVVMPVMSGRELAERLLLLHPKMKVLYMSGYTDDTVVRHGVLEEGVNFFQKPFSMEALVLKVREVLDK